MGGRGCLVAREPVQFAQLIQRTGNGTLVADPFAEPLGSVEVSRRLDEVPGNKVQAAEIKKRLSPQLILTMLLREYQRPQVQSLGALIFASPHKQCRQCPPDSSLTRGARAGVQPQALLKPSLAFFEMIVHEPEVLEMRGELCRGQFLTLIEEPTKGRADVANLSLESFQPVSLVFTVQVGYGTVDEHLIVCGVTLLNRDSIAICTEALTRELSNHLQHGKPW